MRKKLISGVLAVLLVCGTVASSVALSDSGSLKEVNATGKIMNMSNSTSLLANTSVSELATSVQSVSLYGRLGYVINPEDDTVTIVNCAEDTTWVKLTGTIDGHVISGIAKNAFAACKDLEVVELGDGLLSIGENAFAGTKLKEINIPASVLMVDDGAFSNCPELKAVYAYGTKGTTLALGRNIFKGSDNVTLYCGTGTGWATYASFNDVELVQNSKYLVNPDAVKSEKSEKSETDKKTDTNDQDVKKDTEKDNKKKKDKKKDKTETDKSEEKIVDAGSDKDKQDVDPDKKTDDKTDDKSDKSDKSDKKKDKKDESDNTNKSDDKSDDGSKDDDRGLIVSSDDNSSDSNDPKQTIPADVHTRTTYQDYINGYKYIKGVPEGLSETSFKYAEDENGIRFERSGVYITKSDYIVLCNCVANEYGSNWVPEWEMALVCEVVFNMYGWGYNSLYDTIAVPGRFENSDTYLGLNGFSNKVNDRVINAVNTYLSFPEYFDEGYTSFRGDGTWNYFW